MHIVVLRAGCSISGRRAPRIPKTKVQLASIAHSLSRDAVGRQVGVGKLSLQFWIGASWP